MSLHTELTSLNQRVSGLSQGLLPPDNPTASYTDIQVMQMLAFRLLAHAEIESFLERCADYLMSRYADKNKVNALSMSIQRKILLANHMRTKYPPEHVSHGGYTKNVQNEINDLLVRHRTNVVEMNNGIAEKDLLRVFVPLGFELEFFSSTWLASMNDFSAARGAVAHDSWMMSGVKIQPEPNDERLRVNAVFVGVGEIVNKTLALWAMA